MADEARGSDGATPVIVWVTFQIFPGSCITKDLNSSGSRFDGLIMSFMLIQHTRVDNCFYVLQVQRLIINHLSEVYATFPSHSEAQPFLYVHVFKPPAPPRCSLSLNSYHTMSFPSSTRILIVGAGPTGMACALSLWYSGVKDVTIVEAAAEGNGNLASRAMTIHAATLEVRSPDHS